MAKSSKETASFRGLEGEQRSAEPGPTGASQVGDRSPDETSGGDKAGGGEAGERVSFATHSANNYKSRKKTYPTAHSRSQEHGKHGTSCHGPTPGMQEGRTEGGGLSHGWVELGGRR